jgi:PII-like signaling protein
VNQDCLKLTTYCAERDRVGDQFIADALLDLYAAHGFQTSILLRGAEGFGKRDRLQTQRLLSLSEDLPVVTVAVDTRERIERVLPRVEELATHGLVTVERARMLSGNVGYETLREALDEETKLTIYCGRQERARGKPAYVEAVDILHRHGVSGATVLLGVDGTAHGVRERARFFSGNAEVPLMIISVGAGATISAALPELASVLPKPLMTLERVTVCKRDGVRLSEPRHLPDADETGLGLWQKLMIYTGVQARHGRHTLYVDLIRRLREADADGATALRGIWGYHGDHPPHGDKLTSLRRHVPVATILVDTPARIRRWWEIVDEVTDEAGLVTSEVVPAFRAVSPEMRRGGLKLARHWESG